MLINGHRSITHPKIADALADYIGATAEERDNIVHSGYRGTYVSHKIQTDVNNTLEIKEDTPE
jgi:hypothetical protein